MGGRVDAPCLDATKIDWTKSRNVSMKRSCGEVGPHPAAPCPPLVSTIASCQFVIIAAFRFRLSLPPSVSSSPPSVSSVSHHHRLSRTVCCFTPRLSSVGLRHFPLSSPVSAIAPSPSISAVQDAPEQVFLLYLSGEPGAVRRPGVSLKSAAALSPPHLPAHGDIQDSIQAAAGG